MQKLQSLRASQRDETVAPSKGNRRHRHERKNRRQRGNATRRQVVEGFLQVNGDGQATLVTNIESLLSNPSNPVLDQSLLVTWHLASGLRLKGEAVFANGKRPTLTRLISIEGFAPEEYLRQVKPFTKLVSIDPTERFRLETTPEVVETRVVELLAPIGKGNAVS